MPAGRFLVRGVTLTPGARLHLPTDIAHQARDVLRLTCGDHITLLDGAGNDYPAEIVELGRQYVTVHIEAPTPGIGEPPCRIHLYQGMLKAAKFEWMLQKCTELGVAVFVPLLTERAVAAVEATGNAKHSRWERILGEAVEQCGGAVLPELRQPRPLMHALADLAPDALALIPWEEASGTTVRAALAGTPTTTPPALHLFIGPEGGFSAGEIALARRAGVVPVTLGPRVLRAETAAVVATALALDALCELDHPPRGL